MEEAWKRFEQSGSIADYLDYSRKKQTGVAGLDAEFAEEISVDLEEAEGTDGTIDKADRNRTFGE